MPVNAGVPPVLALFDMIGVLCKNAPAGNQILLMVGRKDTTCLRWAASSVSMRSFQN